MKIIIEDKASEEIHPTIKETESQTDNWRCFLATGVFGRLLFRRFKTKDVTVWEHRFSPVDATTMKWHYERSFLGLHASIENSILLTGKGLPDFLVKQRGCIVAYLKDVVATLVNLSKKGSRSIHVLYPKRFFKELAGLYPTFEILLRHADNGSHYVCNDSSFFIDHHLMQIIEDMVVNEYVGRMQADYIHFKSVDLLFAVTKVLMDKSEGKTYDIKEEEITKLAELVEYFSSNLSERHNIPALAKKIGMNEVKLMTTFKKVYATSIHKFLTELRLQKAYVFITTTDMPINEVAFKTGFSSASHFTSVFKSFFGALPKNVRSQQKK